jgi:hypothetical protein
MNLRLLRGVWFGLRGLYKMFNKIGNKIFNLKTIFGGLVLLGLLMGVMGFGAKVVYGQGSIGNTVCCEQTISGAYCQNVPASECSAESRAVPTSCESTSYCRAGTCYDSTEGTCLDNTPQLVCNDNGGIWSEDFPPQCELGCCILGDQAAYVSLVRCKKLSASLGLETNYDTSVGSELACVQKVQLQERGACVYEFEFEKTCEFNTRAECEGSGEVGSGSGNGTASQGTFYAGKLCSAEELATNCGPTTETTCVDGKDEVYFVDSCGNPANVYDSNKVNDLSYWGNVIEKEESCGFGTGSIESKSCGNCDYLKGSICRSENTASSNLGRTSPTYGDFVCADLNCKDTENGKEYRHGESWCVYDDSGSFDDGGNTVGSRFYKHICINGEEVLEQCNDFRAEVCIEDEINDFSQAACRVNRWQDCLGQVEQEDCENNDRRDCIWKEGVFLQLNNSNQGGTGSCFPKNPPGFNFWEDTETQNLCGQANAFCIVKFEKGLFGGEECVENCECLEEDWEKQRIDSCTNLGDCGPSKNWLGQEGYKTGYKIISEKVEEE